MKVLFLLTLIMNDGTIALICKNIICEIHYLAHSRKFSSTKVSHYMVRYALLFTFKTLRLEKVLLKEI